MRRSAPPRRVVGAVRCSPSLAAAPRGQYLGNMPVVDFGGDDRAAGVQHYVFFEQATHAMRLAWYRDEYVRTKDGWRFAARFRPLFGLLIRDFGLGDGFGVSVQCVLNLLGMPFFSTHRGPFRQNR